MENILKYSYENFANVYNNLADDESKLLYRANLAWFLSGPETFFQMVAELDRSKDFGRDELMEYEHFKNDKSKEIVIFGAGNFGMYLFYQLITLKYNVVAFCDSKPELHGGKKLGRPIISPDELAEKYIEAFVIISPEEEVVKNKIFRQLSDLGISKKNICFPKAPGAILSYSKLLYFDDQIHRPVDNEIFIDAGAFDGQTSVDFIKWCKNYQKTPYKVYAIEPTKRGAEETQKNIENCGYNKIVEVIEGAITEKSGFVNLDFRIPGSSKVSESGKTKVKAYTIDELLQDERATFIKMDIEGSELAALKGAEQTIRKFSPRLAICAYHKKDDLIVLPSYIMSINAGYKFYIRKYFATKGDVVLYAVAD